MSGSRPLRVVLVWSDPPGVPRGYADPTPELVDDLDLSVEGPGLLESQFDRLNNVEAITFPSPPRGDFTISVAPHFIPFGPAVGFAVVATGDLAAPAGPGLEAEPGSAAVDGSPLADCQVSQVSIRLRNSGESPSSELSEISIESLDSAVEVVTPMPQPLPPIAPGGSAAFRFQVRAGFRGIPLACGRPVPFRATVFPNGGAEVSDSFSLPGAPGPDGCGSVASLTCAPSQVRPIRLP